MSIEIFPSEDRKSVVFRGDTFVSTMSTSELEATMLALGRCRGTMVPEIPMTWTPNQPVECFRDPKMDFEGEQLAGDLVWHIRHELYGWLHFVISKDTFAKLAAGFAAIAAAPPPTPRGSA